MEKFNINKLTKAFDIEIDSIASDKSISHRCAMFSLFSNETSYIKNPKSNLAVGSLQMCIDAYIKEHGGKVDYIHGDDVTKELGSKPGNIGFLLPPMAKTDLFKTVILDGALPRKTFSMGHSYDKRYYLEARKIK